MNLVSALLFLIMFLILWLIICTLVILHEIKKIKELGKDRGEMTDVKELFEEEIARLAEAYAEERRLIQWSEELVEKGELDVETLADGSFKRAYALLFKKSEDYLTLKMADLAYIQREISDTERCLSESTDYPGTVKMCQESLKILAEQETRIKKEVDEAIAKIDELNISTYH